MVQCLDGLIKFSGDNFHKYLSIAKSSGLKYNQTHKGWYGSDTQMNEALYKMKLVDSTDKKTAEWKPIESGVQFNADLLTHDPLGEYQLEDIKFLTQFKRTLNFNEVGLGKTYETIETLNHLDIDLLVIVTVTEAVYNWRRELKLFGHYTDDDILIVNRELAHTKVFESGKRVIIMDYHKTRTLTKEYAGEEIKKLKEPVWKIPVNPARAAIVLDESHSIKNHEALQTRCLHIHRNLFDYRFLLTATPHPNGVEELWSQLYFWDETFINMQYGTFVRSIASVGNNFSPSAVNYYYQKKVTAFLDKLRPYCLRKTKRECLPNLPQQIINKIFVEPTEKQLKIYNAVTADYVSKLDEFGDKLSEIAMDFPYLTLAASEPSLLQNRVEFSGNKTLLDNWKFNENSKLAMCKELLAKHKNEKIIIWSTHPDTCDLLANEFDAFVMHGQTKIPAGTDRAEYRNNLINEFESSKTKRIGVFNPAVMGTGVNMQFASVNIFWDRSFDVKQYLQALGRTHRANSKMDSIVYLLILDNTLEVYQDQRLDAKKELDAEALKKEFSLARLKSALAGKML